MMMLPCTRARPAGTASAGGVGAEGVTAQAGERGWGWEGGRGPSPSPQSNYMHGVTLPCVMALECPPPPTHPPTHISHPSRGHTKRGGAP